MLWFLQVLFKINHVNKLNIAVIHWMVVVFGEKIFPAERLFKSTALVIDWNYYTNTFQFSSYLPD